MDTTGLPSVLLMSARTVTILQPGVGKPTTYASLTDTKSCESPPHFAANITVSNAKYGGVDEAVHGNQPIIIRHRSLLASLAVLHMDDSFVRGTIPSQLLAQSWHR